MCRHLFEVVESGQDDLVASSDQTHGSQQLQDQSFGPGSGGDHWLENIKDIIFIPII